MRRYEEIPDPESDLSLPLVTITDFDTGDRGKEVVLVVAGEHSRELITSEIAYWLGKLLSGQGHSDVAEWDAYQFMQAKAWEHGLTKETLVDWAETLLKRIVFKVCAVPGSTCATM